MKTIMIIDNDADFDAALTDGLRAKDYNVLTSSTGDEAMETLSRESVDLVLVDTFPADCDGLQLIGELCRMGKEKRYGVMALTSVRNGALFNQIFALGASYIINKGFDISVAVTRVVDYFENEMPAAGVYSETRSGRRLRAPIDEKLSKVFLSVGIPAHIKGFQFLREAIKLTIEEPNIINSITKRLYPAVAEIFDTTPSKVERAIRHAIEVAWNRGKIENINNLFGMKVYGINDKPTNGEFIALVADKMLVEGN